MKNDDNVELWTDPEQEAKVVAMLMGELSAFEMDELEEELAQSPELRLFRDRMIDVQGLISEVNKQEIEDDDWKLSSERRSDLLGNIAQPVKVEKVEVRHSQERKDTTPIQWRSVLSIAACLIVSLFLTAVVFPIKLFKKSEFYKNNEESVSYSATESSSFREDQRNEVNAEYKSKVEAQEDKVEDNRARLYKLSKGLGIPYHGINSQTASTYDQDGKVDSNSDAQMSSAEDYTYFGKVKDEYERELALLQSIKSAEFRETITAGLDVGSISSSESRPSDELTLRGRSKRRDYSKFESLDNSDLVWASKKITNPEMSNEVAKKPSSPNSSMVKAIAANTPSPTVVPVPEIITGEPSLDFGDGEDFGEGWGTGAGAGKSVINGRDAYLKKDYESAVTEHRKALSLLPQGPIADDRRASSNGRLVDREIALASQYKRTGRYDEARELLNGAVTRDPGNISALKELEALNDSIRTSPTLTQEHVQDVEKVRKLLYRGESYFNQAQFDNATSEYKEILRVDPYNKAARRGMEKVNGAKSDYYRAAYDSTRAAMLMEVDKAWETAVPPTPAEGKKASVTNSTREKLQRVQLENVEFTEDTTVRQAINFLRLRARELDSDELDSSKKGLNFKFDDPKVSDKESVNSDPFDEGGGAAVSRGKIENIRLGELNLKNVPLEEAVKQVAQRTGLRYKIEGNDVVFSRATDVDDSEMYTRTFRVPVDFDALLKDDGGSDVSGGDPFEDGIEISDEEPTVKELIERSGIPMPKGSSASFSKERGILTVRNTANNLEIIDELSTQLREYTEKESELRPGEIFLNAYTALEASEKLIQSGDKAQALVQLETALQTYQELSRKHPEWKAPIVQLRLKETKDQIANLKKPKQVKPTKPQTLPLETLATDKTDSTFSLNVSDVSFELAKVAMLEKNSTPDPAKIRVEEFVNAFDYGDPSACGKMVTCAIEQCAHPVYQQRNLMRIGMKTGAIGRSQPLRLTILLDNSGSMEREDREATVIKAIEALASKLGPADEVTLLSFARDARLVAQKLKGDQAGKLVQLVKSIPSEGGTNLSKAIAQAHFLAKKEVSKDTMSRVVLITDGAANLGNADPEELSKAIVTMRQDGIAFDACGVGADGLDDNMLETLTRKGDGRYYFINNAKDADAEFAEKLAGALRPAAKNIKVQVIFNPERVGNYRLLGFEKHLLKKEDFRNDKVDAAEMAAEEAGNALYQVEALPDGRGDIGRVFVRFMDMETGEMVERNWTIPYDPQASNIMDAKPSMQLASLAGLLGEKLKFGESANIDLSRLQDTVGKLRVHYHSDQKVQDLIRMTEKANR